MVPISVIPCSGDTIDWLSRPTRPQNLDFFSPVPKGYPRFNFPRWRGWLPHRWSIVFIRSSEVVVGLAVARTWERNGEVDSQFEVAAFRKFDRPVQVQELREIDDVVDRALAQHPDERTEPQQRRLVGAMAERVSWLRETIEDWSAWADANPIAEELRYPLEEQKDQARLCLAIANISLYELARWNYRPGHNCFLEGLPDEPDEPMLFETGHSELDQLEDDLVFHDFLLELGPKSPPGYHPAQRRFRSQNGQHDMVIYHANKHPLERQTGSDLIYYHVQRRSLVFIQYKRMILEGKSKQRRYRPDKQLDREFERMETVNKIAARNSSSGQGGDGFRLHTNPCFIKLCDPAIAGLSATAPVGGWILPHDYFKYLLESDATTGLRKGKVFTTEAIDQHLNTSMLIDLIKGGWVGTPASATDQLLESIQQLSQNQRGITIALHSQHSE